nr:hypothetical protein [Tanacetum cinerariifolium]
SQQSIPQREGKGIATDEQLESPPKLVKASSVVRPNPDVLILVPYMINGKMFYLTEEQILAHMDKEDHIKKAEEEAKRLTMTKTKTEKIPKELRIRYALPSLVPEQALSQSSRRKRKHMELEPDIKVHGLECNRSLPEGVPFVNNMVIEEPEFGLKLKKLIVEHPDQEKLKSKKVTLEAIGLERCMEVKRGAANHGGDKGFCLVNKVMMHVVGWLLGASALSDVWRDGSSNTWSGTAMLRSFGLAMVVVDHSSLKRASVIRAKEKASPNVVGLKTNNSCYRLSLSPEM